MKRPLKFPLKFEKAIRLITRKRTTTEATPAFKKFYAEKLRQGQMARRGGVNEDKVQRDLSETIGALRKTGFDQGFFEMCQRDYQKRPRHARRKKIKKAVDANKIPKVTKTPLDSQISALLAWEKRRRAEEKVQ